MKKITRRYVVTVENHYGPTFCLGVYKTYEKAVTCIMENIWDFQLSYKKEGDIFLTSELQDMSDDAGKFIVVKYKAHCWTHTDEPYQDIYRILYADEEDED